MPRRNAPKKKFSAVRGCPRSCTRTNPWFCGQILGAKRAQELPPGSAVNHCRFLGTGGGEGKERKLSNDHRYVGFYCVLLARFVMKNGAAIFELMAK